MFDNLPEPRPKLICSRVERNGSKKCRVCGRWRDLQHFYKRFLKSGFISHEYRCLECKRLADRMRTRAKNNQPNVTHKTCPNCKMSKTPAGFYRKTSSKDGLQRKCKLCQRKARVVESARLARKAALRGGKPTVTHKTCSGCLTTKEAIAFRKRTCSPDGLTGKCRRCCIAMQRKNTARAKAAAASRDKHTAPQRKEAA